MAHRPANSRKHQVRIIGGRWKRTPLAVPDIEGLRPTPDRVRETLFNWLGQTLDGKRCLDLFAGSGALSFEAASRGALQVVSVDSSRIATDAIRASIAKLGAQAIEFHQADALAVLNALARRGARFDVAFLDPPFRQGWLDRVLEPVAGLLNDGARVYVESETPIAPSVLDAAGLEILRQDSAGQVHYHLLARAPRDSGNDED